MKILLTADQEQTILNFASMVQFNGSNYYYFPLFLKEEDSLVYTTLTWDELPLRVKDLILTIRGIKLPVNDKPTDGDSCLR